MLPDPLIGNLWSEAQWTLKDREANKDNSERQRTNKTTQISLECSLLFICKLWGTSPPGNHDQQSIKSLGCELLVLLHHILVLFIHKQQWKQNQNVCLACYNMSSEVFSPDKLTYVSVYIAFEPLIMYNMCFGTVTNSESTGALALIV